MTVSAGKKNKSPTTAPARVLTPGRIVALRLTAVTIAGLAYLRSLPDAGLVSVPKGPRRATSSSSAATTPTEKSSYEADCGTLVVPENRADPKSRLIALPVTRIHARSDHPAEPIFRLQGGPGLTNMEFTGAGRFAERHDIVLVGYRGADGSPKLDRPEVTSAHEHACDFPQR